MCGGELRAVPAILRTQEPAALVIFPVDPREQWRIDRSTVEEREELIGETSRSAARCDRLFVGVDPGDTEPWYRAKQVWDIGRAGPADVFFGEHADGRGRFGALFGFF